MIKMNYKISKYNERVEKVLKTKIRNYNLLINKNFQKFMDKYAKEFDTISPDDLYKIYKSSRLKIKHILKTKNTKLIIDPFSIDYESEKTRYCNYDSFKSNIIDEIERQIDIRCELKEKLDMTEDKDTRYSLYEEINDKDNYINKLDKKIDSDIEIVSSVNSIKAISNKLGFIVRFEVKSNDKKYKIDLMKVFERDKEK